MDRTGRAADDLKNLVTDLPSYGGALALDHHPPAPDIAPDDIGSAISRTADPVGADAVPPQEVSHGLLELLVPEMVYLG